MDFDLIFRGGKIVTMDEKLSVRGSLGIKDGKIVALEENDIVGNASKIIELNGRTVLPGLMDCHVHVMPAGLNLSAVQLEKAGTIKNVLDLLDEACRKAGADDEWVFGSGYIAQGIKENRYPNKDELDRISHGKKILVMAATLHGCALNTAAMDVCKIPENLPGVEKDAGAPNGIYASDESSFLACANALGDLPDEKLWKYIDDCARNAASKGVTEMHGLFGMFIKDDRDVSLILGKKDCLPIGMTVWYQTWDVGKANEMGLPRVGGCLTWMGHPLNTPWQISSHIKALPASGAFCTITTTRFTKSLNVRTSSICRSRSMPSATGPSTS